MVEAGGEGARLGTTKTGISHFPMARAEDMVVMSRTHASLLSTIMIGDRLRTIMARILNLLPHLIPGLPKAHTRGKTRLLHRGATQMSEYRLHLPRKMDISTRSTPPGGGEGPSNNHKVSHFYIPR